MIRGELRSNLTVDTVFNKISEYDIYRYYMPSTNWEVNMNTMSPFRVERDPSFRIYNAYGKLYHIDFADSRYRGGCLDFVMQMFTLNTMNDALEKVDVDFGLGLRNKANLGDYKKIIAAYRQPEELGRRNAFIQVTVRKFTLDELAYWNQYHQDIEDLRVNNIYSISKVYLNRKLHQLPESDLRFGYFYDGYWKIYRPFAEDKTRKWFPNNVPNKTMEGIENLVQTSPAFINKSKKDYMVMKKLYPHCCAVQNEGMSCFTHENVELLKSKSSSQILSFDSDVPGVKSSLEITKSFGFGYCNVPRAYLKEGIKDWADLAKKYGMNIIEHYLRQKFIL